MLCTLVAAAAFVLLPLDPPRRRDQGGDDTSPPPNALTPAEQQDGWRLLFDGKTSKGWRGYRQKSFPAKGWAVEDGMLHVQAHGGGGDIVTEEQFGDFELQLEWRVAPGANSGVMYRVAETADTPWQTGPEYTPRPRRPRSTR
jgi:hypothetical protein